MSHKFKVGDTVSIRRDTSSYSVKAGDLGKVILMIPARTDPSYPSVQVQVEMYLPQRPGDSTLYLSGRLLWFAETDLDGWYQPQLSIIQLNTTPVPKPLSPSDGSVLVSDGTNYRWLRADGNLDVTINLPNGCTIDPNKLYPQDSDLFNEGNPNHTETCHHVYKEYYGLKESYQYCTKCDKKLNNNP